MKAYKFTEFQSIVKELNDLNLTFMKIDESYSNIKALYESACYLNKVNNRNLIDGIIDSVKSIQLFSSEKQELAWFSIESNKKRSVKWFFILLASEQLFLTYENTKKLLSNL